ncbi:secretory pathway protein Sec39-domain-containing protein [Cryomyces antarcticus]
MVEELSAAQCILLAIHFASESNIEALHNLTPSRPDVFEPELALRILINFLPESMEPSLYTTYAYEVATRLYLEQRPETAIDTTSVKDLSDAQAQKRFKKLHISPLSHPSFPPDAPDDVFTRFIVHRAHLIDKQTGLLELLPQLVVPFLDRNDFIRTWYISAILPLLRMSYEYYPGTDPPLSIEAFEGLTGAQGIDVLLAKATDTKHKVTSDTESAGTVGRDLRGLVGPWMYGNTDRKRRKLNEKSRRRPSVASAAESMKRISLNGVSEEDRTGHDWEYAYKWMVHTATKDFPLIANAIEEWDGPEDVDFGGYERDRPYLDDDIQQKLDRQYAQAAFASIYAAEADTADTINGAHGVLVRLAGLLDFEPPPDLATSVEMLPRVDRHASVLHESQSTAFLKPEALLQPEHPLTTPRLDTFSLLQMLVYSAYQLASLGHSISIVNVAKLRFYSDEDEQLAMLRKITHGLMSKLEKDEEQWVANRSKLLWLWNWGIDAEEANAQRGTGVLGKIDRGLFEKEMLKAFVNSSCYSLAIKTYLENPSRQNRLPIEVVEGVILASAMYLYDNASNGNRTRGGMKRASDIISTFRPYFPHSASFRRTAALLSATHALSFYALTLQHGVPFQPVSIRVSSDPISLLSKVLAQNPGSYAKLDDLIDIGRNLVIAAPLSSNNGGDGKDVEIDEAGGTRGPPSGPTEAEVERAKREAERRVTGMAIEAALAEDDFETAYSYVVNRLTHSAPTPSPSALSIPGSKPPSRTASSRTPSYQEKQANPETQDIDNISWRAAFAAGRYRPSTSSASLIASSYNSQAMHQGAASSAQNLRHLEQRLDLLSAALLLAPATAIVEILSVWRRCEEELSALLKQDEAEDDFNDRARTGNVHKSALPGGFETDRDEGMIVGQERREVGRLGGTNSRRDGGGPNSKPRPGSATSFGRTGTGRNSTKLEEEAPMGLFDVARSAAAAFGRSAFPLRGASGTATPISTFDSTRSAAARASDDDITMAGMEGSTGSLGTDRTDHSRTFSGSGSETGSLRDGREAERVRKRDQLANAVTGGLASGIGWVLGATPMPQAAHRELQQQREKAAEEEDEKGEGEGGWEDF